MVTALFGLLEQVLKLGVIAAEERHLYDDDLKRLKEEWYAEFNKPETDMSDVVLDDIDLKLRILTESIEQALRAKNAKN